MLQVKREDQEETEIMLRRQLAAHLDNPRGLLSSVCLNTTLLRSWSREEGLKQNREGGNGKNIENL